MTTFTETRRDLAETKTFTPDTPPIHSQYGKTIFVTHVVIDYALRNVEVGEAECTEKVMLRGNNVLKSGKPGKETTNDLWNWHIMQRNNAWEQPEWLIRLVEDNRPGWWTTTD